MCLTCACLVQCSNLYRPMGSAVCLVGDVGGLASIGMPECVCSGGWVSALDLVVPGGACGCSAHPCRVGREVQGGCA